MSDESDEGSDVAEVTGTTMDARLKDVRLPGGQRAAIYVRNAGSAAMEGVLEAIPGGSLLTKVKTAIDASEAEIQDRKRDALIIEYWDRADRTEASVANLMGFVSNPWGNVLFTQIQRILFESPPDAELTQRLAEALRRIINSDFKSLFEQHKFALGLISQMSSQTMALLAAHASWTPFTVGSFTASGTMLNGDWSGDFVGCFAPTIGLTDSAEIGRLQFTVSAMIRNGLMVGMISGIPMSSAGASVHPLPSEVACSVIPYLE